MSMGDFGERMHPDGAPGTVSNAYRQALGDSLYEERLEQERQSFAIGVLASAASRDHVKAKARLLNALTSVLFCAVLTGFLVLGCWFGFMVAAHA